MVVRVIGRRMVMRRWWWWEVGDGYWKGVGGSGGYRVVGC